MMSCEVIASGSKGNAVILNGDILVDCGVPFKALKGKTGGLMFVLLTHIHGDHFNPKTLKRLHEERPSLRFLVPPWLYQPMVTIGISSRVVDCINFGHFQIKYIAGEIKYKFMLEPVLHDVENCVWHIEVGEDKAFYATDAADLEGIDAQGYGIYLIEANYTKTEMEERIRRKQEVGGYVYEGRVLATHLSREAADAWLARNAVPGVSRVIYIHQHETGREVKNARKKDLRKPAKSPKEI